MTAPETRGDPISKQTYHKGQVWKPDNLIVLSSRFIINIFIKLIAEKSPGLLNSRQIHLLLARLTANNSVVREIGLEWVNAPALMTDKLLICVEMIWGFQKERKKKCHCLVTTTIAPLFQIVSTKLEEHERGIYCWGRAENTCCCTSGFTNHSSKRLSLPYVVQVKKNVYSVSSPK